MNRKICVVTGTRAEYGLLRWLMQGIKDDPTLKLQVIATGMHLSPIFGSTYKEIEKDGFHIDQKVEVLGPSDTTYDISNSISEGLIGCAKALEELKPDLVVLLGDRFEIFSAATASLVARIPVAHIHGGESTEGLLDEAFRHSITKMSQLHFVAAEEYKNRVIQLGEDPKHVYLVGGLGIDSIRKMPILGKVELERELKLSFRSKSLLITFHPVTLENDTAEKQMQELLAALSTLDDTTLVFTMPNADSGGRLLIKMVEDFVSINQNAHAYTSLGQHLYLSAVAYVDGVIGNSSSGLIEAPSFKKGTVNIGDRQLGRLRANSVIDCEPNRNDISRALAILYSSQFQKDLKVTINPYGVGGASEKILEILRSVNISDLLKKKFYTLENT
jgi:GDP/UDP-N,N'-diacetylbacillosamine 2-epimerase (hydrolysing)